MRKEQHHKGWNEIKTNDSWSIFKISIEKLLLAAKEINSEKIQLELDQIIPEIIPSPCDSHLKNPNDNSRRDIIKAKA